MSFKMFEKHLKFGHSRVDHSASSMEVYVIFLLVGIFASIQFTSLKKKVFENSQFLAPTNAQSLSVAREVIPQMVNVVTQNMNCATSTWQIYRDSILSQINQIVSNSNGFLNQFLADYSKLTVNYRGILNFSRVPSHVRTIRNSLNAVLVSLNSLRGNVLKTDKDFYQLLDDFTKSSYDKIIFAVLIVCQNFFSSCKIDMLNAFYALFNTLSTALGDCNQIINTAVIDADLTLGSVVASTQLNKFKWCVRNLRNTSSRRDVTVSRNCVNRVILMC